MFAASTFSMHMLLLEHMHHVCMFLQHPQPPSRLQTQVQHAVIPNRYSCSVNSYSFYHILDTFGSHPRLIGLSEVQGNSGSAANGGGQRGRGRSRGGGSAKRARGGTLTLQDLMEAGIIFPGRNNISVHYKGTVYTASLGKDGMILYQGMLLPACSGILHSQLST